MLYIKVQMINNQVLSYVYFNPQRFPQFNLEDLMENLKK